MDLPGTITPRLPWEHRRAPQHFDGVVVPEDQRIIRTGSRRCFKIPFVSPEGIDLRALPSERVVVAELTAWFVFGFWVPGAAARVHSPYTSEVFVAATDDFPAWAALALLDQP